jgi:hypothetical protein
MTKAPMDETTRSHLYEQETSIAFDELDGEAELYTASPRVFKLLMKRGLSPYKVETLDGKPRGWFFTLPKWSVLLKPGRVAIKIGGARKINSIAPGVAPSATSSEVSRFPHSNGKATKSEVKQMDERKCPKCGQTTKPDSNFCSECGAKISAECPDCRMKGHKKGQPDSCPGEECLYATT